MAKTEIKSEIRKHYLLNKYVIITPGRAGRPRDIAEETVVKRTAACVLCPKKTEKKLLIEAVGGEKNWQVAVLKNKYPAVTLDNPKAYGTQEVIIETPEHGVEMADLSRKKIEKILWVYAKRTKAVSQNKKIDYVLIFKNSGSKAGASLFHSHSQLFATKILPPEILDELTLAQAYKNEHDRCAYCDIIKKESRSARLIFEDKHLIAFAPYASEFHYEVWLFTKRHLDNVAKLNKEEIGSFALALKKILGKLRRLNLAYNFFMHQIVSDPDQHFHLKIQPRDSVWAGVELGSGLIINSVSPEEAAKYFRK